MKYSVKKIKKLARANLMANYRFVMQIFLISTMIPMVIDSLYSMVEGDNFTLMNDIIFYAVEFIILVITNVLAMGKIRVHLYLARHEQTETKDLFFCFTHSSDHFFLAAILRVLISVIASSPILVAIYDINANYEHFSVYDAMLVCGAALLALLLNVIAVLMLHPFYYLVMEFNDMPLLFALKESVRLMKGNKLRLLHLYVSFIGMLVLCVLSLGVGALWVTPYMDQSLSIFYLDVIEEIVEWKMTPPQENSSCPQF